MLTRDKYQEEQEEDSINGVRDLLLRNFKDPSREILMITDSYYNDRENIPYRLCLVAKELGLLDSICEQEGFEYAFFDYTYDRSLKKYIDSKFIFQRRKKEKGLKLVSPYSKYPHK